MHESAGRPKRSRGRRNDGLRKLCDCGPRTWAKCSHPWHFNFCHGKNPNGSKRHYRFSLDKRLGRRLTSKSEAETEAERIRIAIRDGVFDAPRTEPEAPADVLTLSTYAAEWLLTITGRLKASTIGFYRDNLDHHVLPLLGARPVAEIKRGDCITLITTLRGKSLKIRTIRGVVRTLSTVLTQATDEGKLDSNPALNLRNYLKRGDEAETEIDPFDAADAEHFAETAREHFSKWHTRSCSAGYARECGSASCSGSNGVISTGATARSRCGATGRAARSLRRRTISGERCGCRRS
jgi:hypothetical protein